MRTQLRHPFYHHPLSAPSAGKGMCLILSDLETHHASLLAFLKRGKQSSLCRISRPITESNFGSAKVFRYHERQKKRVQPRVPRAPLFD